MSALKIISMNENIEALSPEILIIPTSAAHIRELSKTIRESDRKEIENYGFSCAKGLWMSYKKGLFNKTALLNGEVAACWGCGGTFMGAVGIPWLLTSNKVKCVSPLKFARIYQDEVYKMLNLFGRLENYVLADYPEAVRLLEIVGFSVSEPMPYGPNGAMFRKFQMAQRP